MFDVPWGDLLPFLAVGIVVADASVAIRGDLSGFHQDLNRAKADTGTLGDKLKNALSPRNIIAGAGLLGIGLGIRQLTGYAGEAADAFSELQQTQRTTDEVFGKSASVIEDWATRSADAAGMSQRTVFQSASVMGQTLINMGFAADEAAEKTVMLQQRAAELAIAFGSTPERAILAITAAMRGERDTIEKFGVSIKQVDVNAKVAALGLDTSTAAAKKNAEAIAILDLVMEQTAGQADRFAESQDDVAVKMAQANAKIDDFMATQVGPAVASIQLGAIKVAEGFLDAGEAVGGFFEHLNDPRFAELAVALGVTMGEARDQVSAALQETGQDFDTTIDGMLMSAYELGEEGAESFDHFTAAFTAMRGPIDEAADGIATAIPRAVLEHWQEIHDAGEDAVDAYRLGIFDNQDDLMSEIDALLKNLDERMEPGEEIAYLRGKKIELFMARGIAEEKGDLGAVAAINALIAEINAQLNGLNGYSYGKNLALTMSQGIKDYTESAKISAYALGGIIRRGVGIESEPEDHNSPLYGITKWGGNIVKTIAEGMTGELGTGQAAARALAGALVPSMGAAVGMTGSPTVMGAGSTYILQVNGQEKVVGSRDEVLAAWEQMTRASGEPV